MHTSYLYRTITSLAVALAASAARADGLHFHVRTLPTQQQLPVATVRAVFQDSEGMMWYATQGGGLCRDNGYQVNTFRSDANTPGLLGDNHVNCMAEDGRGRLWFGTNSRLYTIDKRTLRIEPQGVDGPITALGHDSRGRLWVGTRGGVHCLDTRDGRTLLLDTAKAVRGASQFTEDSQRRLWVATWGKAPVRYSERSRRLEAQPWHYAHGVEAMAEDAALGGFWVATWGGGVVFYDPKTGEATAQPATLGGPDKQDCIDLLLDHTQGLLWVTTLDNLYIYRREGRRLVEVDASAFLPAGRKIVDHLCEDRAGNVWVAGFAPNTFIVSPREATMRRETVPEMARLTGFPLLPDRMVADDGGRAYWIWQGRKGLMLYDKATGRLAAVPGRYDRCVAKASRGEGLWAADGRTPCHVTVQGAQPQVRRMAALDSPIQCITDEPGATFQLVGTRKALYKGDLALGHLEKLCDTPEAVVAATGPVDGVAYCVTAHHFIRRGGTDAPLTLASPRQETFTSMAHTPDGRVWAATQQGSVYGLADDGKTLRRERLMSCANGDAIIDMATDPTGHLWLLSNQYVREFNPNTFAFRTLRNTDADVGVSYFYKLEPTAGQRMGVCGAGAYCEFEPSKKLDRRNAAGTAALLTAIGMDDSLMLCDGTLRRVEVEGGTASVVLYCSTLEHLDASKVAFAYRIDGGDWIYLPQGVNTIYLSRLPKGVTRVAVKATDRHGSWSPTETLIAIDRLPQWWETWWARALALLVAAAVAYGLWLLNRRIRYMLALQRHRKTLALTEVEVRLEELEKPDGRADEFLKKAVALVEAHLTDTDYSVEAFSSDMCMSRMSLYRKMQAVTGLSPNEFLRDVRLKNAASILRRHPGLTATQVAARVGFATPKYFSKCFKEKFGMSPAQYAANEKQPKNP